MHPSGTSTILPKRPRRRGVGWVGGIFFSWAIGVTVLVAELAREGCDAMRSETDEAVPAGWTLRHELDPRHPDVDLVARRLLEGPPRPDGRESIVLHGSSERLQQRLQSAGWSVANAAEEATDFLPRLQVIAPDGTVAWTGHFNPADLASPGSTILGFAVLAEVAQGRMPPPLVPVACARPSQSL